MKKIFIPSAGVNIDICTEGCGGIFFDNREFKKFDEQQENIEEISRELEGKEFTHAPEDDRFCPACGAKMVKNFSSVKHEIQVDECYTCGGIFLDNDELKKIRAEYKTDAERSEDMVDHLYEIAAQAGIDGKDLEHVKNVSERKVDSEEVFNRLRLQKKLDNRNRSLLGKIFNKLAGI
jgi:Zn-finger nucleic acid-binding protein